MGIRHEVPRTSRNYPQTDFGSNTTRTLKARFPAAGVTGSGEGGCTAADGKGRRCRRNRQRDFDDRGIPRSRLGIRSRQKSKAGTSGPSPLPLLPRPSLTVCHGSFDLPSKLDPTLEMISKLRDWSRLLGYIGDSGPMLSPSYLLHLQPPSLGNSNGGKGGGIESRSVNAISRERERSRRGRIRAG